jgi:hypothetical protein
MSLWRFSDMGPLVDLREQEEHLYCDGLRAIWPGAARSFVGAGMRILILSSHGLVSVHKFAPRLDTNLHLLRITEALRALHRKASGETADGSVPPPPDQCGVSAVVPDPIEFSAISERARLDRRLQPINVYP